MSGPSLGTTSWSLAPRSVPRRREGAGASHPHMACSTIPELSGCQVHERVPAFLSSVSSLFLFRLLSVGESFVVLTSFGIKGTIRRCCGRAWLGGWIKC